MRRTPVFWRASMACMIVLGAPGCTKAMFWLGGGRCDALRVSSDRLAEEIDLHARVRMQIAGSEVGFDVIAQRRGAALHLVGLAVPGPRLFALRQQGETVDFVDTPRGAPRALAMRTLDALHRGLWVAPTEAASGGEERRWTAHGERVAERETLAGRSRTYLPMESGRAAPPISIEYRPDTGSGRPLGFEIHNPGCRYDASVVLIESWVP
jgi:hypothetical protein